MLPFSNRVTDTPSQIACEPFANVRKPSKWSARYAGSTSPPKSPESPQIGFGPIRSKIPAHRARKVPKPAKSFCFELPLFRRFDGVDFSQVMFYA
jgi:hypothetical protein